MPHSTGIRALSRPFSLSNNSKKSSKQTVVLEKHDTVLQSELLERRPSRGTMEMLSSRKGKGISLHIPGHNSSPSEAKRKTKGSPRITPTLPARLIIDMESPPNVFHGTTTQSTGALFSGQLLLTVTEPEMNLTCFTMTLYAKLTTRKPVTKDCPDCCTKTTELFKWKFLSEPKHLEKGTHNFPFSYLLPGHLPATSHTELAQADYFLAAKATTSLEDTITAERPLVVQRALMPGPERNSIRIFPPTNLTTTLTLPSVIHPIGNFPVQMRMTGLVDTSIADIHRRWRVRKVNWRIEEHSRIISAACEKHAHKIGGVGKGVLHEDTRTIGSDDLKSGWKSDFDTPGGQVEMEFNASVKANSHPVCDVDSPTGLSASHNLVVEIVVAEEQIAAKGGKYVNPTGAARVLRMQFKLTLTERAGMGISWDEEMPPMYEDVPNSPPHYQGMENYEGDLASLPNDELEHMSDHHASSSTGRQRSLS